MAYTKKEALAVIFSCALQYKQNLVERSLLFVCMDKHKNVHCLEVTFDASNFMHMTGFKTEESGIRPLHFWDLCLDQRLAESDFEFSDDGTTQLKLKVLPGLVRSNLSAKMLGDYNMSHPKLYTEKIAGGINACVGFVRTGEGGRYVPNTVLEGDIRHKVKRPDRIILTYRKRRGETQYNEIVYCAKKVDWTKIKLPENYSYLTLPDTADKNKPVEEVTEKLPVQDNSTEVINAIVTYRDLEWSDDQVINKLVKRFNLSEEQAIEFMIRLEN